jgi:hypothetical protein
MDDVKIIYCYDENNNPIHHSKAAKGEKYFCIDCGLELVCRDGKKNIKHLAHKNTLNCGGTGESIFHKHWKENLFKAGMFINVANRINPPDNVEILDVLNEISLRERYNKNWDIDIIVDTLLITEKGEIVVEIHYTNPKDWDKLKPYYDELNLLRVYEVTVGKSINTPLRWFCLGEEDEIMMQREYLKLKEEEKIIEKARLKLEKQQEKERQLRELAKELTRKGTYKKVKVFFNFKNELVKIDKNTYELQCLTESNNKYEKIILRFDLKNPRYTLSGLRDIFEVKNGIRYCNVTVQFNVFDGTYEVVSVGNTFSAEYNSRLYANLCNIK